MTRELFTFLVKSSQKEFRRFLAALCCGDTQLADDIAQDSFLKAYMSLDSISDPSNFKSWLYRIGINTFVSHKRAAHPMLRETEAAGHASDSTADAAFRYQALYEALDRLLPRERSVILLYYMEGYSAREIADISGSTEAAVKQQLSRGRQHLRSLISNE